MCIFETTRNTYTSNNKNMAVALIEGLMYTLAPFIAMVIVMMSDIINKQD